MDSEEKEEKPIAEGKEEATVTYADEVEEDELAIDGDHEED